MTLQSQVVHPAKIPKKNPKIFFSKQFVNSAITYFFLLLLLCGSKLEAFETKPWFYSLFEFQAKAEYEFSYFPSVQNGINPTGYSSPNNFLRLGMLIPFLPTWEAEIGLEFDSTRRYSFGFESGGVSIRKQFWSDVEGDPVSFVVGGNLIFVPQQRLFDVVTPYHNIANFELNFSLGKEFVDQADWYGRLYGFGAVGQANKGYPWLSFLVKGQAKFQHRFILSLFTQGYFGLGNQKTVNIGLFNSYADIAHRSIDLGAGLTYLFEIWGQICLNYAYRIYAASYPERTNSVILSYQLPWSL